MDDNITSNVLKFADDTLFRKVKHDGDKQHLQNDLDKLVEWSEKLNRGRASSQDDILAELMKCMAGLLADTIASIFNDALERQKPLELRKCVLTQLRKPGKPIVCMSNCFTIGTLEDLVARRSVEDCAESQRLPHILNNNLQCV